MKSLECDWGEKDVTLQALPQLLLDTRSDGICRKGMSSPPILVLDPQTHVSSLPAKTMRDATTIFASGKPQQIVQCYCAWAVLGGQSTLLLCTKWLGRRDSWQAG